MPDTNTSGGFSDWYRAFKRKYRNVWRNLRGSVYGGEHATSSFSQCGEDILLKFIFQCLDIKKPSYLDIGAHHPFRFSNTAMLYLLGSRGVNVEPDPELIGEFQKKRAGDINLNVGISAEEGELDFFVMDTPTLNSFSKEAVLAAEKSGLGRVVKKIKVKTKTVDSIVSEYCHGQFPVFLNLDVEGIALSILDSIDFKTNYPQVICLETLEISEDGNAHKEKDLIEYLLARDYEVFADTYVNTLFVRKGFWKHS